MKSKLYAHCGSSSFCSNSKVDPSGSDGPFMSIPKMPLSCRFLPSSAKDLTTFYMYRAQSDNDYAAWLDSERLPWGIP